MNALAHCTDETLTGDTHADQLEAMIRRSVAQRRAEFAVRAGRCEDVFGPSESTPACLLPLRTAWGRMLSVAQSPAPDPIALEVAVRHVGDAWNTARQRCN